MDPNEEIVYLPEPMVITLNMFSYSGIRTGILALQKLVTAIVCTMHAWGRTAYFDPTFDVSQVICIEFLGFHLQYHLEL